MEKQSLKNQKSKTLYFAISGVAGIGKTTSLTWLAEYLRSLTPFVSLPDSIDPIDEDFPNDELIQFLAEQKLKRETIVRKHLEKGVAVICDRTYLDPLSLAMTLLEEKDWRDLELWYSHHDFVYGHHIILKAPSSIVKDRRMKRGSSPRSTFLRSLNLSQSQYESRFVKYWRFVHISRHIPYYEVDFSSSNEETNLEMLSRIVKPLVKTGIDAL